MKYLLYLFIALVISSKCYSEDPLTLSQLISSGANAWIKAETEAKEGAEVDSDEDDDQKWGENSASVATATLSSTSGGVIAIAIGTGAASKGDTTSTKVKMYTRMSFSTDCDVGSQSNSTAEAELRGVALVDAIYSILNNNGQHDWVKGKFEFGCDYTSLAGNGDPLMQCRIKQIVGSNQITAKYDRIDDHWDINYHIYDENGDLIEDGDGETGEGIDVEVEDHDLKDWSVSFNSRIDNIGTITALSHIEKWKNPAPPSEYSNLESKASSNPSIGFTTVEEQVTFLGKLEFEVFDNNPDP